MDLPLTENWEQLNDLLKAELLIASPLGVRTFKDISSAVLEIAQGTAQFFSHKKSVGFVKGQTPTFDFLLPYFYKEAYQVKITGYLQMDDIKAWVEALNKDTAFVLYAEDHPVTGEVYSFCDELDRLLNEKRIGSFRISHARFAAENLEVRPYSVRICSWASDLCVALCGERFRSPALVAHRQHWDKEGVLQNLRNARAAWKQDPQAVQDFEKSFAAVAGVQPWFSARQTQRLWDRALLIFNDVSAEALAEKIFAHFGWSVTEGWRHIETTNMCRWSAVRMYNSWWEPLPPDDVLRGLLIFSADLLKTKDFAKLVLSSYEEIKNLQAWT